MFEDLPGHHRSKHLKAAPVDDRALRTNRSTAGVAISLSTHLAHHFPRIPRTTGLVGEADHRIFGFASTQDPGPSRRNRGACRTESGRVPGTAGISSVPSGRCLGALGTVPGTARNRAGQTRGRLQVARFRPTRVLRHRPDWSEARLSTTNDGIGEGARHRRNRGGCPAPPGIGHRTVRARLGSRLGWVPGTARESARVHGARHRSESGRTTRNRGAELARRAAQSSSAVECAALALTEHNRNVAWAEIAKLDDELVPI